MGRREKASRPVDSPTRLVTALRSCVVDRLEFYSIAASSIPMELDASDPLFVPIHRPKTSQQPHSFLFSPRSDCPVLFKLPTGEDLLILSCIFENQITDCMSYHRLQVSQ